MVNTLAQWSRTGTSNPVITVGKSSRQAVSDISWDKMAEKAERDLEKRIR